MTTTTKRPTSTLISDLASAYAGNVSRGRAEQVQLQSALCTTGLCVLRMALCHDVPQCLVQHKIGLPALQRPSGATDVPPIPFPASGPRTDMRHKPQGACCRCRSRSSALTAALSSSSPFVSFSYLRFFFSFRRAPESSRQSRAERTYGCTRAGPLCYAVLFPAQPLASESMPFRRSRE
jgi:hypothetical protein